jgi:hypothetical protein
VRRSGTLTLKGALRHGVQGAKLDRYRAMAVILISLLRAPRGRGHPPVASPWGSGRWVPSAASGGFQRTVTPSGGYPTLWAPEYVGGGVGSTYESTETSTAP